MNQNLLNITDDVNNGDVASAKLKLHTEFEDRLVQKLVPIYKEIKDSIFKSGE